MSQLQQNYRLAIELINRGRTAEGRALLEENLKADPADGPTSFAIAKLDAENLEYAAALARFETLLEHPVLGPDAAPMILHVLSLDRRAQEALARGVELQRRFPENRGLAMELAAACSTLGEYARAEEVLRARYEQNPDADVASTLSSVLLNLGRNGEALALLRAVLERDPGNVACLAALASATNYISDSREEGFRRHRALARVAEFSLPVIDPLSYDNSPDPERPIRIALLSFDFRAHSVAYFVEAILRHRDRSRYHITAYSTSAIEDEVTDRLRPLADDWKRHTSGAPRMLAREVFAGRTDVVVELGGLTGGSPLPALIPQVAPVQVTAIGYPNTTGFSTVHYRLVDSLTDPPGESDACSTERLVRLDPCFLCFTPRVLREPARIGAGPEVVFASFNKITKYSDACLRTFAAVLRAVPGSRLLLKSPALHVASACELLKHRLLDAGAPGGSIEFAAKQEEELDHLAMYDRVDIALDSFPYNGTTTTCEALLMGVPVIALEGSTHAGRVGRSLLAAAGIPGLVARSRDEYVALAASIARDVAKLRASRSERAKQFLASPLCDGPAYASRWQDAIRSMWRLWCERKRSRSSPSAPR